MDFLATYLEWLQYAANHHCNQNVTKNGGEVNKQDHEGHESPPSPSPSRTKDTKPIPTRTLSV